MNIKKIIAKNLDYNNKNFEDMIIESISSDKGDYSLPCFAMAKEERKSPMLIAEEIKNSIKKNDFIIKAEVQGGYLNFFLNIPKLSETILKELNDKSSFKSNEGENKVICIDYASPNLAKYLHIGHLKTTIIGESLARLFEQKGYTVKRLNYVGDYGTPFGKIIGGLKKWGSIEDVKQRGNDALQEYYVKFNKEEADDPNLTQYARDIFKKIEDKDPEIYPLYEFIIKIARADSEKMFDLLGVKFDDWRGENYYNTFVPQVVNMLNEKHLLTTSEGAKIVDLSPYDLTPAVILKSDGTSLYTTRDICAVIERKKYYNFDKMIYVTDIAQILNFKQLFKIIELCGFDFYKDMEHVAYGRFSLPDGKISSRRGKQATLVDLAEYATSKAREVIANRTFTIENPETVVKKVTSAVLNYSVLKTERLKDSVFEIDKAFAFDGETAPYMQYTYTRLASILRKYNVNDSECDYSALDETAFGLIKMINTFNETTDIALAKRDPSIVSKRIMDMCKTFNKYYNSTKILEGENTQINAKIALVKALKNCLAVGFNLICIDTLEEM